MKSLKKGFKKIATAATFFIMTLTSTQQVQAQEFCGGMEYGSNLAGCGYEESYCAPSMTPYIILATVAVIAIIVLATSNSHHKHHSHCH